MGDKNNFSSLYTVETATIADQASLSGAIATNGLTPVRLQVPAGIEGTAFTFQVSLDGVTYANFYDEFGVEVNYTMAASRTVDLPFATWKAVRWFKIRTGTAASASAQTGAAAILVQLEAY